MVLRLGVWGPWVAVAAGSVAAALIAFPAAGLPAGGTSAPLAVAHSVALHVTLSSEPDTIVAAEAPDGAAFFAKGARVYVVDGNSAPTTAESAGSKVVALAASNGSLYVETRSEVTAYSRSSGAKTTSWTVADTGEFAPSLAVDAGDVWSLTSPATDASGLEPATLRLLRVGHAARQISGNAYPSNLAVDSAGDAFFLTLNGRLGRSTPNGVTLRSSKKAYYNAVLAYGDNTLLVEIDGAHTIDKLVNPRTLTLESQHPGHVGDYFGLVQTTVGLLHLDLNCSHNATCAKVAVRRIRLPDTAAGSLKVGFGNALLGPKPIVISAPAGHDATLHRLS